MQHGRLREDGNAARAILRNGHRSQRPIPDRAAYSTTSAGARRHRIGRCAATRPAYGSGRRSRPRNSSWPPNAPTLPPAETTTLPPSASDAWPARIELIERLGAEKLVYCRLVDPRQEDPRPGSASAPLAHPPTLVTVRVEAMLNLPEPGALHLTRQSDLLELELPSPDLSIYEPKSDQP